jgi:hypothetical protein
MLSRHEDPEVIEEDDFFEYQHVRSSDDAVAIQIGRGRILLINRGSEVIREISKASNTVLGEFIGWVDVYAGVWMDLSVLGSEKYAEWALGRFDTREIQDVAVSGWSADPDGDGVPNLLEFAFNMEPKSSSGNLSMPAGSGTSGLPALVVGQSGGSVPEISIQYLRRKNSGLQYLPQFASDLADAASWASGGGAIQTTIDPIDSEWERVTVKETPPAGVSKRFARVLVAAE